MLEFKPVELSDKPQVDSAMWAENSRSADFNFANIYMWDKTYKQCVSHSHNRTFIKAQYSESPFFVYPIGSGDLKSALEELYDYAEKNSFPFCLRGITQEHIQHLEAVCPGKFSFREDRAYFDYIYSAEKLASLSGKKLHSKRNHINRFIESNDWSFEPLSTELVPECMALLAGWEATFPDPHDVDLLAEHAAIYRAFKNFEYLQLEGGVLRSAGKLIAFTIGEKISSDTYNIHFEKAHADIQGSYPMINREFARYILDIHPEIKYINREDDMGKENLRKAKLSYYPEFLLEKYTTACM